MDASSIFFAIPTRGSIHNKTVSRLERIRAENPSLGPIGYSAGHLSSHETREQIAQFFMQSDKDVLMMLDDDVVPPLDILEMTRSLHAYTPEGPRDGFKVFDVVGAAVPMFQPKVAPIPLLMAWDYVESENAWMTVDDVWGQTGVVECDGVGFGCVAIHRRAFEKLEPPYFPMEYNAAGTITDDLAFCRRVCDAGLRVACDFDRYCEHHTTVPLMQLAQGVSDLIEAALKSD